MSIVDTVEDWILNVAIKKGITRGVMAVAAVLASAKVAPVLANLGISINTDTLTVGLSGFAMAGLEMIRNYLKLKFGWKWLG